MLKLTAMRVELSGRVGCRGSKASRVKGFDRSKRQTNLPYTPKSKAGIRQRPKNAAGENAERLLCASRRRVVNWLEQIVNRRLLTAIPPDAICYRYESSASFIVKSGDAKRKSDLLIILNSTVDPQAGTMCLRTCGATTSMHTRAICWRKPQRSSALASFGMCGTPSRLRS